MALKKVNLEGLEKMAFENGGQKDFHTLYRETLYFFTITKFKKNKTIYDKVFHLIYIRYIY